MLGARSALGDGPTECSLLAAVKNILWGRTLCASEATAILVCGGEPLREEFAARMASKGPLASVDLIVSSGMYRRVGDFDPENSDNPHRAAMQGVNFPSVRQRLRLDRSAVDTVGNFTTTVRLLRELGHRHIVMVTSAEHMRRAATCAAIVLGSYSISFTTVSCELAVGHSSLPRSQRHNERSWWKTLCCCCSTSERFRHSTSGGSETIRAEGWIRIARDACRCVLWVVTGCDGESVARYWHPNRH